VTVGVEEDVDILGPVASCLAEAGGLEASGTVRAGERVRSGVSVLGQVRWSWCWLAHYASFLALVSPRLSVDISGAKSWAALVAIGFVATGRGVAVSSDAGLGVVLVASVVPVGSSGCPQTQHGRPMSFLTTIQAVTN